MKLEDLKYTKDPFRPRNRIEAALRNPEFLPPIQKPEQERPQSPNLNESSKVENSLKTENRKLKILKRTLLALLMVVFVGALVWGSLLIYRQYSATKATTNESVLAEVGKLIDLPKDEEPTIATVSDLAPLKGQPFFENAEMGDKVLIYMAAKRAVLYRPSTKKVIIVAPIN